MAEELETINKDKIESCPICDSFNIYLQESSYEEGCRHIVTWECQECYSVWIEEYSMISALLLKKGK